MTNPKVKILVSSGALIETASFSRYYFNSSSTGLFKTELFTGGLFIPDTGIIVNGAAPNFPKRFESQGGVRLTGTGLPGTQIYETLTFKPSFIVTVTLDGSSVIAEKTGGPQYYYIPVNSTTYVTRAYNSAEFFSAGYLKLTGSAPTFPKIREGSGGVKLTGSGILGTQYYSFPIYSILPFTQTTLPIAETYGQSLGRPHFGYILPEAGVYNGEDIEGPSGLKLGGSAEFFKVQKITYVFTPGRCILGGTSDPNSASNKHYQTPIISGELLLPHSILDYPLDNFADCIWIRKYEWIGQEGVFIFGPNNSYTDVISTFSTSTYLQRDVLGTAFESGSYGAVYWSWDQIKKVSNNTNILVHDTGGRKFGNAPGCFTWFIRFKPSSHLNEIVDSECILLSRVISRYQTDEPWREYGSHLFVILETGHNPINKIIIGNKALPDDSGFSWSSNSLFTVINYEIENRLLIQIDTGQSIESNRVKVYLNGSLLSYDSDETFFPQQYASVYDNTAVDSNFPYWYDAIGGTFFDYSQFLGTIYEVLYLDGYTKSDGELYPTSYTGPYTSEYSYHLKFSNLINLGADFSNHGNHFVANIDEVNEKYSENNLFPYGISYSLEPVLSAQDTNFVSLASDKTFTFYSKVYVPNCIRYYGIYNKWDEDDLNTLETQGLRKFGYTLEHPTRFTIAARIWVDPRHETIAHTSYTPLTILSLTAADDSTYDPYYTQQDLFTVYLNAESSGYNSDQEFKGVSIYVYSWWGNCEIELKAPLISVNSYHRLVIQLDTTVSDEEDRVKIYLDGSRIDKIGDESNVVSRLKINWETEPPSFYEDWGYPVIGEEVFNNWNLLTPPDHVIISVGSEGYSSPVQPQWQSFFGRLSDVILLDGLIVDPDVILPISGSYAGPYGGLGSFHYKFETVGEDSGPNVYHLTNAGTDFVTRSIFNENSGTALFGIKDRDPYYSPITQYFRLGFSNDNTKQALAFEAIGDVYAYGVTNTEITPDTWHEIQFSVDLTESTASDRIKIYLDKEQLSYTGSPIYLSSSYNLYSGSGWIYQPIISIGGIDLNDFTIANTGFIGNLKSTIYLDGYTIEPEFFDDSMSSISYGGQGFRLDYLTTNLGLDSSPHGYDFTNSNVYNNAEDYESSYDFGKALGFIIYRDTTPISDILLPFKLISAEAVELTLVFDIKLDPQTITLPFKLYGEGQEVELILPFKLLWSSNFDSGSYSTTNTITVVYETLISLTYENLTSVLVTDITNTLHYEFGTSAIDPSSKNGWVDTVTGKIYIFTLEDQYNKGASNVIYSGSEINVHYDYNLSQSTLLWQMTCSAGQLIGDISVEYEEDASTIAKFTLLPPSGEVDPLEYIGSTVTLDIAFLDSAGNSYPDSGGRVFTGLISEVEWDADLRVINVTADTQMPAYFNALTRDQIEEIIGGIWSDQVWDNEDDSTGWTYAQERLSTTEDTIWHDKNWTLRINSFRASTPTLTFTDDERFHETLKLEFAQRSEMTNQIRIDMDYKYPRRRERTIKFKWTDPSNGNIQTYLCGGNSYQLCQRSMIEGAATGSSWVPITKITYTSIWPPQGVWCGPGSYDGIVWGYQVNDIYTPQKDKDGNYARVVMVNTDSGSTKKSDNTMYKQVISGGDTSETTFYEGYENDPSSSVGAVSMVPESVTSGLCLSAQWSAARRWLQDVSEYYEMVVQCQDSIDTIGVVATSESYSVDSNIQDPEWENSITPYKNDAPSGFKVIPGPEDKYWNTDSDPDNDTENIVTREDFELAQEVVLTAAKVDVLKAHRLTTVSFKIPYNSSVDLSKTVSVSTPYLSATGKTKIVKHQFSIDTGEASTELFLAISRHNGSGLYQDDPLQPLERPDPSTESSISNFVILDNHVGGRTYGNIGFTGKWYDGRSEGTEDPNDEGEWLEDPWEGFMTNYESPLNSNDWNAYWSVPSNLFNEAAWKARLDVSDYIIPYQFVVKGPDIDESHTSSNEVQTPETFNVVVPVDPLELYA